MRNSALMRGSRETGFKSIVRAVSPGSSKEKYVEDRVAIFIDGSNLYHALRSNFNRYDLKFAEFTAKLCGARRLFRTYYYNVLQDPTQRAESSREQQDFLSALRETPYLEVRLGRTKMAQGIPVEKGIDVMLVTDLLHFAWNGLYEVAILVSGDSDFAYALQAVKNMGKHVEVAYFESNVSRDLLDVADNKHLLDHGFFKTLWTRKRPPRRKAKRPGPGPGRTNSVPVEKPSPV
ncbi:MAG: NYN domain-containing protein [Dehalococcoidia bacterium]|nr:NYN domain-containing protein [Dehalococcoidia bacterium]